MAHFVRITIIFHEFSCATAVLIFPSLPTTSGIHYVEENGRLTPNAALEERSKKSFCYGEFDNLMCKSDISFETKETFENWDVDVVSHLDTLR
jgi:hypothetical protein